MRGLVWLACVACSATDHHAEVISAAPAPLDAAIAVLPAPVVPRPPRPAVPEGAIATLVAAEHASAALTFGADGAGFRLWPSFDGKHEPVIIPATPTQAGLIQTADGFAILTLDRIGQPTLTTTTRDGGVIEQRVLEVARPLVQLVATDHAFVALADDQHVVTFGPAGELLATLVPDPGEPIHQLLARGERAFAVIQLDSRHVVVRAIASGSWGTRSAKLAIEGPFAISPDGRRIAGSATSQPDSVQTIVRDLASGERVTDPFRAGLSGVFPEQPVWLTNKTLALWQPGQMYIWNIGDYVAEQLDGFPSDPVGTSHDGLLTTDGTAIVLYTDVHHPKRLGYRHADLADLVPVARGFIASDRHHVMRMSPGFEIQTTFDLPAGPVAALIDARHVVIRQGETHVLCTLGKPEETVSLVDGVHFTFERATGWAMSQDGASYELMHWDGREFSAPVDYPVVGFNMRLYSSGPLAAFSRDADERHIEVVELRNIDPSGHDGKAIVEQRRLTTRDVVNNPSMMGASNEELLAALPVDTLRAKSPGGTFTAELTGRRLSLRANDGSELWARAADGARGVAWSADGRLVVWGAGIAEVDLSTGTFAGARCGWQFGLAAYDTEAPISFGSAELCAAR